VCPWNARFAKELPEDSPFKPREALAGKDARQLAREILAMDVDAYRAAFRGSPMKRAKLPMLKRNAAVALGNVGTADDVDVLTRALDEEPDSMVREHAAWALRRIEDDLVGSPRRPAEAADAEPRGALDVRR
jgi:epoxyqueuosine reductase